MHHSDGRRLRDELRLVERHGRGRPYPQELRRRVAAFGSVRARQGAAHHTIARELGIAGRTLARWLQESLAPFVAVELADPLPTPTPRVIIVHGACGLRVEGLDLAQLASLLRSLA